MMRLILEHLTNDLIMLCDGPVVLASVQLLNPDVLVSPRFSDSCFVIIPGSGRLSMSFLPDRDQIRLEVDSIAKAIIHIRADVTVCFYGSDMFAIRIM